MIGSEVQKALHDALKTAPAASGGRVYDSVPAGASFPYISIGEEQVVGDGNSCGGGWEVFADVNVWSRKPGLPEAKDIAATVVDRVTDISSIPGFRLVSVEFVDSLPRRDPDGLTSRVILTFRFIIDQA